MGKSGGDTLYGGAGFDELIGSDGYNMFYGGDHDDILRGGNDFNMLYGDDGNDHIYGGDFIDALSGGNGNDFIDGGAQGDAIYGENGDDILYGGIGDDILYGGSGDNKLYGGDGDDSMTSEDGNDYFDGGEGNDSYYFARNFGHDTVNNYDISGRDKFTVRQNYKDTVYSREENDMVILTSDGSTIKVENYFKSNNYKIDNIQFQNNESISSKNIELLIHAMAEYCSKKGVSWTNDLAENNEDVQIILSQYYSNV